MKPLVLCAIMVLGMPAVVDAADGRKGTAGTEREARVHRHAAAIDRRIDAALRNGRVSPRQAAGMHRQVGQVQVEAGHAGRTQAALTAQQAAAFDAALTRIESPLPKR